ncbi:MAG: prepilin-type N-terminal cleavage/methylation domain-containing protein [Phycisphaeraceae bacterium]|nr:prepilin-type N-terminal cleavage/methylation domain-containing protein [Phycisphaeraceae bacterium]
MHHTHAPHPRRGFTLIELLVVVSVIALLIGILLPSLSVAKDKAQAVRCMANLRSLANAAVSHTGDHKGLFSTGPSDNRMRNGYGPIRTTGWMADFIRGEYANPGQLLCPTHPVKDNQNMSFERLNDRPWESVRIEDQERLLVAGYNTNYAQSWYMAYTGMKSHRNLSLDPRRTEGVIGPLSTKYVDTIGAAIIPLFGDAKTNATEQGTFLGERRRVIKALTDGPIVGANGYWDRQDYDDLGPAHGRDSFVFSRGTDKLTGNIAFADGHVATFKDSKPTNGERDGEWGMRFDTSTGRLVYDELEGAVYGGWLSEPSPIQ